MNKPNITIAAVCTLVLAACGTANLTPRGRKWIPQSVYSMRKKYARRLERLGEGW